MLSLNQIKFLNATLCVAFDNYVKQNENFKLSKIHLDKFISGMKNHFKPE